MKVELQQTIMITMTMDEAEKLINALHEVEADAIPDWADKVIDQFYNPLKKQLEKE